MAYNDKVERTGTSRTAREIPEKVASQILKEAAEESVALQLGQKHQMTTFQERIPLLSGFATAKWQGGANQAEKDSKPKATTKVTWDNVYITSEEIAVLMVVPDAWAADSNIGWSELTYELKRAFAKAIDLAIFFGASEDGSLPASFGNGIIPDAVAAGNVFVNGGQPAPNDDLYGSILAMGKSLKKQGYKMGGFAAEPGFDFELQEARDGYGRPLYQPSLQGDVGGKVLGRVYKEVENGAWDEDEAKLVGGDWSALHIGIRQGMTFAVSDSAVLRDETGAITYSAFQDDGKVLRAVMRLGYKVLSPKKVLGGEYPFAVLQPDPSAT